MIPALCKYRASDPYWSSVTSLLHFDGTNGSTSFTDQVSNKVWSASGASISTSKSKFGGASGYFNGSSYINTASSADWYFGVGDFTVEGWIYINSNSARAGIWSNFDTSSGSTNDGGFALELTPTNQLNYVHQGIAFVFNSGAATVPTGGWHHVAASRTSGTAYLFIDGVLAASQADSTNFTSSGTPSLTVGVSLDSTNHYLNANLDEIRVTNGVGRYTASFAPPTSAFPNS